MAKKMRHTKVTAITLKKKETYSGVDNTKIIPKLNQNLKLNQKVPTAQTNLLISIQIGMFISQHCALKLTIRSL